jgi:hypothetical protein
MEADAAGIDISASCISVRYESITVLNCFPLFRNRTASGIGIFVHADTGLTGCRESGIPALIKLYILQVHTAGGGSERDTPCK